MCRPRIDLVRAVAALLVLCAVTACRAQRPAPHVTPSGCAWVGGSTSQLRGTFIVVAHRGNTGTTPENTLAAFDAAFDAGASAIEVDVHLTSDGIPVVIHDETLERTTSGAGLVAQTTLESLRSLDAGSWMGWQFAHEKIPTLAEVLELAKSRNRGVLLDLKVDNIGRSIPNLLAETGFPAAWLIVATQTPEQTADFVVHSSASEIVLNFEAPPSWPVTLFETLRASGLSGVELGANWSRRFVAEAHRHQMPVYTYVINDAATMNNLLTDGVDGMETDDPAELARVLRGRGWTFDCAR